MSKVVEYSPQVVHNKIKLLVLLLQPLLQISPRTKVSFLATLHDAGSEVASPVDLPDGFLKLSEIDVHLKAGQQTVRFSSLGCLVIAWQLSHTSLSTAIA